MKYYKIQVIFITILFLLPSFYSIFVLPLNNENNIEISFSDLENNIQNIFPLQKSDTRSARDIWIDSFLQDSLIEEMKNVELKNENVELSETDFINSTTLDFDNGSKSSSNDNFEIETNTDNPGISKNQFELGNGKGDRFNFDDNDSDTWKWDYQEIFKTGGSGTFNHDISNGKLNLKINGKNAHCGIVSNFTIDKTNDFEVKMRIDMTSQNVASYHTFGVWDAHSIKEYNCTPNGVKIFYCGNAGRIDTLKFKSGTGTLLTQKAIGIKNFLYFKIKYVKNTNTFSMHYSFDDNNWVTANTVTDVTLDSDPYVLLILTQGGIQNTVTSEYDNYELINGKLVNGYRTSGNWESSIIDLSDKYSITDTTIDFTSLIAGKSEIDRIEWLESGVVKATYETDIKDPGASPLTISENDLTSGSFSNIIKNFTIKVYLISDGEHTPMIQKISGSLKCLVGHLISKPIQLNQNYCWESVSVSKTTTIDTDIKVSVLNGITDEHIEGFENLTDTFIDLSTLDSKLYPIIQLRADFYGSSIFSPILQEWSVSWVEDYPVLNPEIPSDYSLKEDTDVKHLINLGNYFNDYYDSTDKLTFRVAHQSNKKHLEAVIDGCFIDFYTKLENWFGKESFKVECMDTGGLKTMSNSFEVTVTPVNDPPYWTKNLPDLKLDEDLEIRDWIDLDEYIDDIEDDYLDFKIINQSNPDNISVEINFENKVSITPRQDFFGSGSISIQAFETNNKNFYANDTFKVTVFPKSDPPIITPNIIDRTVNEDKWLNLTIFVNDPDPDENHSFRSNISKPNFNLGLYSGKLSFHPTNDDVGFLFVNITVEDKDALKGFGDFKITINNVNDPPDDPQIISPIDGAEYKINEPIEFLAENCYDIDKGDIINYSWDFDFTNGIQKENFGRKVNHSYKIAGIYKITLTITDGKVEKSTFIILNITKSTKPSPISPIDDIIKSSGENNFVWAILLGIMIMIIIMIIVIILILKKKRGIQPYDVRKTPALQPAAAYLPRTSTITPGTQQFMSQPQVIHTTPIIPQPSQQLLAPTTPTTQSVSQLPPHQPPIRVPIETTAEEQKARIDTELTLQQKLALLEKRLLQGEISEETYLNLKDKYEMVAKQYKPPPQLPSQTIVQSHATTPVVSQESLLRKQQPTSDYTPQK